MTPRNRYWLTRRTTRRCNVLWLPTSRNCGMASGSNAPHSPDRGLSFNRKERGEGWCYRGSVLRGSYYVFFKGENRFIIFSAFLVVFVSLNKLLTFKGIASTMWRAARSIVCWWIHVMSMDPTKVYWFSTKNILQQKRFSKKKFTAEMNVALKVFDSITTGNFFQFLQNVNGLKHFSTSTFWYETVLFKIFTSTATGISGVFLGFLQDFYSDHSAYRVFLFGSITQSRAKDGLVTDAIFFF